jgi:hypothetical protein
MIPKAICSSWIKIPTINNTEDHDMPIETPPKLIEAMEMLRRLHLLLNSHN